MRLHDLTPARGSHRDRKRLGRGNATGQGTTAGKGTKGEKARSGGLKAGFRGMSSRNARLPKRRGFNNKFKEFYRAINVEQLGRFSSGTSISLDQLVEAGLVNKSEQRVKILGDGELGVALQIVGLKVSASARQKIEAAGGEVTDEARPFTPSATSKPAPVKASPPPTEPAAAPAAAAPVPEPAPEQEAKPAPRRRARASTPAPEAAAATEATSQVAPETDVATAGSSPDEIVGVEAKPKRTRAPRAKKVSAE